MRWGEWMKLRKNKFEEIWDFEEVEVGGGNE